MPIIDYKINGETFYTHSTWLSSKQRTAWHNIPQENKNLALYYSLSTLALIAIGHRRIPMVSAYFRQLGFYSGSAILSAGTYLGWSIIMRSRSSFELNNVIERNDCLYTPFWKSQQAVVNLKEAAKNDKQSAKRYVNRSAGKYSKKAQVQKFNPDVILEHSRADELAQRIV